MESKLKHNGAPPPHTSTKRVLSWQWSNWYSHYLRNGEFPHEVGEALVVLFRSVCKLYPPEYWSPDSVKVERGGVAEEFFYWFEAKKPGDAAQSIIVNTFSAWIRSKTFQENFLRDQWTDKQIHFYVRRIMENELRRVRRERKPTAWWWMHDLMLKVASQYLHCTNEFRQVYVPAEWLQQGELPEEKEESELAPVLNSVPRWRGEIPGRLTVRELYDKLIRRIFENVRAPIPFADLVAGALRTMGLSPNHPIPLEDNGSGGGETQRGQKDIPDPAAERYFASVEVAQWVDGCLSRLQKQHLLVIKYVVCEALKPSEVAERVRQVLGVERFQKTTVGNRLNDAVQLFRRSLKQGGKSIVAGLPTTAIEQEVFQKVLCTVLDQRLARMSILKAAATG